MNRLFFIVSCFLFLAPTHLLLGLRVSDVLEAVAQHVAVSLAPQQRAELGHRNEARQVAHFGFGVAVIRDARQVEQLGALVDFGPAQEEEGG